jgi:hypothetical protein
MQKLMEAYCERQGLHMDNTMFSLDGVRIMKDDTPDGLELEDQDTIDEFQRKDYPDMFLADTISPDYGIPSENNRGRKLEEVLARLRNKAASKMSRHGLVFEIKVEPMYVFYVCIPVRACVCIHRHQTHNRIHVHAHTHIHTRIQYGIAHTRARKYTRMQTGIGIYICTNIHTDTNNKLHNMIVVHTFVCVCERVHVNKFLLDLLSFIAYVHTSTCIPHMCTNKPIFT